MASANGATAVGSANGIAPTEAIANGASAFGSGAQARATNSTAIGGGAIATLVNQQVFGTTSNLYTMPGINGASTAAQVGQTKIVTADAAGTLGTTTTASLGLASSTDIAGLQSQINNLGKRDSELADGIAISLALAQPILLPGQTFAVRGGWGNFDGSNAVGFTAAGVLGKGNFGPGTSIVADAGIGTSTQENMVAGRAGLTVGW